jgi:Ca2+-binding RTX toxin-like protein
MGKIFVSTDLRILPGRLVQFGDDGSNPVVGYVLQDISSPAASFRNAGTVSVSSALSGAYGFTHDNGFFHGSLFHNEQTGVFSVKSTAANGSAWGFDSWSWSADFLNEGTFKVISKYAFATGVETWDSSFSFSNAGVMKIEARKEATGVFMANGGEFNNSGTLKATGTESAVGAFLRGHNVEKIYNSGQLIADSKNGVSVALYIQQFGDTTSLIYNSGILQGDYAIYSDDYGVSPSAKSIQIVDNTGQIKGDVDLGLNNDVVRNSGNIVGNVYLGEGDDLYQGSTGLLTGAVSGGGGNDTLVGGAGRDFLFGDAGSDEIMGGAGNDSIDGGRGGDVLDGGDGRDTVSFQTATAAVTVDLAAGRAQADALDAIRNFEIVIGSAYADRISGTVLADVLEGAYGADILLGGAGDDTLIGDQLGDTLTGGAGNDQFLFSKGDGADIITDFVAGGSEDSLQIYGYTAYQALQQQGADTRVVLSATDSILLKAVQASSLTDRDFRFYAEELTPPPATPEPLASIDVRKDLIITAAETLNIQGRVGFYLNEDVPAGTASIFNSGHVRITSLDATTGVRPVEGLYFWSVFANLPGATFEVASQGFYEAVGMAAGGASPWIYNAGQLTVTAEAGNAVGFYTYWVIFAFVNTGALTVTSASGPATGGQMHNGGEFWNTGQINVSGQSAATGMLIRGSDWTFSNSGTIRATAGAGFEGVGVSYSNAGGSGGESGSKVFYNSGIIEATYAIRQDAWTSGEANSIERIVNSGELRGRVLLAEGREEIYNSGKITGRIDLGSENDLYDGRSGTEQGGVYGGTGDDMLFAGAGVDILDGGDGADVLSGGADSDILTGGAGADVFRFATGNGADTIIDFVASTDRVDLAGRSYSLRQQGADTVLTFTDGGTVLFKGVTAASLTPSVLGAITSLPGPPVGEAYIGGDAADYIVGTSKAETLSGGGGADYIEANLGDDRLEGGLGNDILRPGWGLDTLIGGAGADTFVFELYGEIDTVLDFKAVEGDRLDLVGFSSFKIRQIGLDVVVDIFDGFNRSGEVILRNTTVASVSGAIRLSSDAPVAPITAPLTPILGGPLELPRQPVIPNTAKPATSLVGGAGADVLNGGRSNDTLDGGAGDDILTPGSGIDRLWGGAGNDTFVFRDGDLRDFLPFAPRILDFAAGDRIRLEGFANFSVEASGSDGSDILLYAGGPDGSGGPIVLINTTVEAVRAAVDLITRGTPNLISGTDSANILTGTAGADDLRGLGGDDQLRGGDGADDIEGGAGADIINGGRGRDVLRGGSRMNGGDSDGDIFVHQVGDGDDTIMDFAAHFGDKILLLGVDTFQTAMDGSSLQLYTYVGGVLQDIITVRNIYNQGQFSQYVFLAPIPAPSSPTPADILDLTQDGAAINDILTGDGRNETSGLGRHDALNGALDWRLGQFTHDHHGWMLA